MGATKHMEYDCFFCHNEGGDKTAPIAIQTKLGGFKELCLALIANGQTDFTLTGG